jgi:hypothetical protein
MRPAPNDTPEGGIVSRALNEALRVRRSFGRQAESLTEGLVILAG